MQIKIFTFVKNYLFWRKFTPNWLKDKLSLHFFMVISHELIHETKLKHHTNKCQRFLEILIAQKQNQQHTREWIKLKIIRLTADLMKKCKCDNRTFVIAVNRYMLCDDGTKILMCNFKWYECSAWKFSACAASRNFHAKSKHPYQHKWDKYKINPKTL